MDRFYSDDENEKPYFESEEEEFGEDFDMEDVVSYVQSPELIQLMQIELAHNDQKQHLLNKAVEIAEKGFFWRFKSTLAKMQEIELIYQSLRIITGENEEPEVEEDEEE